MFGFLSKCKQDKENMKRDIDNLRETVSKLGNILMDVQKEIEGNMLMQQVNDALDECMADMFWVKAIDGKYLLANKAIREHLLFDDNPVGKYDVDMAKAQKERVGPENHTFGEICANSDLIVLDKQKPMKFNEDGIVNGKYMMLQVHKNVLRNEHGMIIGTVGTGRDITYETQAIQDVIDTTTCKIAKRKLIALLEHYAYTDRSSNG
jgi:hypothetical protein